MIRGLNTLRPRQNGRHFADNIFKRSFFNKNVWISIKISLKFVPKGPINKIPALIQIMAWRRPGDKPLLEAMLVSLLMDKCVTHPQWVNTLRSELEWLTFSRWHLQMHISERKLFYFELSFTEVCLQGSSGQYINIGSGNGLALVWSEPRWPTSLTHLCVTRPHCLVNKIKGFDIAHVPRLLIHKCLECPRPA